MKVSDWIIATVIVGAFVAGIAHDPQPPVFEGPPLRPSPSAEPAVPHSHPSVASRTRAAPPRPLSELWAARSDVRALRVCESGDRVGAVSPSGKYHGLYQTTASWGTGSRQEQNAGAFTLWERHGSQPWPHCGRFMRKTPTP